MRRSWRLWLAFGASAAVLLAAMGWISAAVLRLDRAEREARDRATQEENIRLALWRMDSALAPLVARENIRPFYAYNTFLPLDQTLSRMLNDNGKSVVMLPSPLVTYDSPHVLVHFQVGPDGEFSSPRVPAKRVYHLAVPAYLSTDAVSRASTQLDVVRRLADRTKLLAMLPETSFAPLAPIFGNADLGANEANRRLRSGAEQQAEPVAQQIRRRSQQEFQSRNALVLQQQNTYSGSQAGQQAIQAAGQQDSFSINANPQMFNNWSGLQNSWNWDTAFATDVAGVLMQPLWIDGELILARRVRINGGEYVQGCLLDWPGVRDGLFQTIADLLPAAELEPVVGTPAGDESRLLAAIPVRLNPGPLLTLGGGSMDPIKASLVVSWACVLLAAGAVALMVAGVERLGQRRAAFVTAVTHELRTPLTTFQMYAEMLAEGMVPDPARQKEYLETLRGEAGRLTHLVENVLAYARLERGRRTGQIGPVSVDRLLEQCESRLGSRAARAGMTLCLEPDDDALEASIRTNASAVEQILLNLVDNSCKYAGHADDKRIHLGVRLAGDRARLTIRDHGPGIPPEKKGRVFRSFSKTAHEAANTAPGIGLGLALSLRLARDMGGNLKSEPPEDGGAAFTLTLPLADITSHAEPSDPDSKTTRE